MRAKRRAKEKGFGSIAGRDRGMKKAQRFLGTGWGWRMVRDGPAEGWRRVRGCLAKFRRVRPRTVDGGMV